MKYLIYAAYGSNMLKEKFMCYIKGGVFEGKNYTESTYKSEPEDVGWMCSPHSLYFAKKSPRWDNKGVAFLSCKKESNSDYYATVHLWKISGKQFNDIQQKEGKSWYDIILPIGEKDCLKIKTISGSWENENSVLVKDTLN